MVPEAADTERFAEWVREYGGAVRGYLRGVIGRLDAIDDLFQEVFTRAWQGRFYCTSANANRRFAVPRTDLLAQTPFTR